MINTNQFSKREGLSILSVVAITSFMGTFLVSAVNIALPTIEHDLSLTAIELSWIITSFILGMAMFMIPAGSWGDRTDNRKLFKFGLILFIIASVLCYVAPNGHWLLAARFIQGAGAAFTGTTGQAILVSSFPPNKRGQVLGISVSSVYIGLALGPAIGGVITEQFGWRILFSIATILGIITLIVSLIFLKSNRKIKRESKKGDPFGTILFMAGLITLVYGSSQIPSTNGWVLMALSLILLLIFWKIESKVRYPLLDTNLYTSNRLFTYSNMAALINYTSTFAISFFLSLYLQKILDLSPRHAGAVIIAQPIMMAIFSPIVGRASDKIQPRYLATTGMAMCTTGLGMLTFLSSNTPIWIIITILIWVGLGFALFSSPNMNTIMSSVDRKQYGQASGLAASMRVFGQIISMSTITLLISFNFGNQSVEAVSDQLFLTAMRWVFVIFAIIGIPGIYFSHFRGNVSKQ
ncbi:MAG: MFS transporter [Fermentimonas sp.]|jgi:EmrB/QacA subfamily drug resistance transporter|nr:MFS transporter [Fermentimonas sp.]MDD2930285.1 MFS transporter [Fermentimonas sp.]MDD3510388.1 MFS transporter [Fermentimonas sp.]MDD4283990.1 MFS transporter [Fermentimonas sp.]MDD4723864.1 MFS transporter [Fermentimonas sp.]